MQRWLNGIQLNIITPAHLFQHLHFTWVAGTRTICIILWAGQPNYLYGWGEGKPMRVRYSHWPTVSDYIQSWLILILLVYCSAGLALAASKAQDIPPPALPDTSQIQASQGSSAIEPARPILKLADATLPTVPKPTTPNDTQTTLVSKSTKGSGKAKMHPGPTKNGWYIWKNLCWHHTDCS